MARRAAVGVGEGDDAADEAGEGAADDFYFVADRVIAQESAGAGGEGEEGEGEPGEEGGGFGGGGCYGRYREAKRVVGKRGKRWAKAKCEEFKAVSRRP
jgi:hypothetical protein